MTQCYVKYNTFEITNKNNQICIEDGFLFGNVISKMFFKNNWKFTTFNSDNDDYIGGNCATYRGNVSLNGRYQFTKSLILYKWKNKSNSAISRGGKIGSVPVNDNEEPFHMGRGFAFPDIGCFGPRVIVF